MDLATTLEQTPAWPHTAMRVLLTHAKEIGPALARGGVDLRLRVAELTAAAGDAAGAWRLAEALDPVAIGPGKGERVLALRLRLVARAPGSPPVTLPEGGLARLRALVITAERATLTGDLGARSAAWADAARLGATLAPGMHAEARFPPDADGRAADELTFEASAQAAIGAALTDLPAAKAHLDVAAAIARRWEAPAEEASLGLLRLAVLSGLGDLSGLVAQAARARELPEDVPGALPAGVRAQLDAAGLARAHDPAGAVRALDAGLDEAHARGDVAAYLALATAKTRLFDALGDGYQAYRALTLARAWARKVAGSDSGFEPIVTALRARWGEAWDSYAPRLRAELEAT